MNNNIYSNVAVGAAEAEGGDVAEAPVVREPWG